MIISIIDIYTAITTRVQHSN